MKFNLQDIKDAADAVTKPLLSLIRGDAPPQSSSISIPKEEKSAVHFIGFQTAKKVQTTLNTRDRLLDIGVSICNNGPSLPPNPEDIKIIFSPEVKQNIENEEDILLEKLHLGINYYITRALEAHDIQEESGENDLSFNTEVFYRIDDLKVAFISYLANLSKKNPPNLLLANYMTHWIRKVIQSNWQDSAELKNFHQEANLELPPLEQ